MNINQYWMEYFKHPMMAAFIVLFLSVCAITLIWIAIDRYDPLVYQSDGSIDFRKSEKCKKNLSRIKAIKTVLIILPFIPMKILIEIVLAKIQNIDWSSLFQTTETTTSVDGSTIYFLCIIILLSRIVINTSR